MGKLKSMVIPWWIYGKEAMVYSIGNYFFDGEKRVMRDAVSLFEYPGFIMSSILSYSVHLVLFTSMSLTCSYSVIVL